MTNILLVQKGGTIKQTKIKDLSRDILYKKCGFRKDTDFEKRTTWVVEIGDTKHHIELWAKVNGKANTENKYDFPPPVDTELYFGICCLVSVVPNTDKFLDLTRELWNKIYEKLFGGFENLDSDEEISEDELENVAAELKTKNGYLKDGFVVEDNVMCQDNDEDDNLDDELEHDEPENEEDLINLVISIEEEEEEEEDEEEEDEDDDGSELMAETYDYSDED
jgi:hypothetical protein